MSSDWDSHQGAVAVARDVIGEAQELISGLREKLENATGATVNAVGDPPVTESGRMAVEFLTGARDRLDEIFGMTANAVAELERYGGGF